MAQVVTLKARGLYTFPNSLSEIPDGALVQADNVVIDRNSVVEPRRGLAQYGTEFGLGTDRAKQLLVYKDRILNHYQNTIQYDSDGSGTFQSFSGNYTETETGLRIKYIEANGNLYFTTSSGIKKISATSASDFTTASGYIINSGAAKALDVTGEIDYTNSGFFTAESKVAYRIVWGYEDNNNNLILGSPSSRLVITNFSTTNTGIVNLTFVIPDEIDTTRTDYFYQIYRTEVIPKGVAASLDDIDPGDEMNIVIEDFPTSSELTAGIVTATDITPEDFRVNGTPLYTNPISGDGITSANEPPPLAKDITLFKNTVFYANTQTKHKLNLSLLSVSSLISGTSTITITNGTTANTYTFIGAKEVTNIDFSSYSGTIPGDLDGKYFLINSASNERKYYVWYDATGTTVDPGTDTLTYTDLVGRLGIKVDISSGVTTTANLADATAAAIVLNSDFDVSYTASNTFLDVTNANNGNTDDAIDSAVNGVGMGISISVTTQGDGEDAAMNEILLSAKATPSQQIDETALSIVNIINQNSNEIVSAFYLSGPTDVPGLILLETKNLDTGEFFVLANSTTTGDEFNPSLPDDKTGTAATGTGTVTITSASHGLSNGNSIVIYDSLTTPSIDGIYSISNITTNTFDISSTVTVSGNVTFGLTDVDSDNEVQPNGLYFSKYQQPEAVPIINFIPIGPKDKKILRILALRESLFILKEDGVYRLTGENGAFSVNLFDGSTQILAPDSAAVLNNQIYFLTAQDIVTVTDTGVSVISRPIENEITKLKAINPSNISTATFGVSFESDRAYILWTVTTSNDTVATQAFRWNTFTNLWTKRTDSKTCGVVIGEDQLYAGPADENFIEKERRNFSRKDYADREIILSLPSDAIGDKTVKLSSISSVEIGDSLVQTQYLTIYQFNQLLKKLDIDPGVADTDYFSVLEIDPGEDIRNFVNNLAVKLDADTGVTDTDYFASLNGGSTFTIIQSDFNIIIDKLNLDAGVIYTNYKQSIGTIEREVIITGLVKTINTVSNTVYVKFNTPFILGNISLFKSIKTNVIWAPHHFGDPSIEKHVREGTFLFENTVFTTATVSYKSDISPDFEEISFNEAGNGDFGFFIWNEQNWGGEGSSVPLRTYIPRDKQRCRYLNPKFEHSGAREKFALFGISLTFRPVSTRAYRS